MKYIQNDRNKNVKMLQNILTVFLAAMMIFMIFGCEKNVNDEKEGKDAEKVEIADDIKDSDEESELNDEENESKNEENKLQFVSINDLSNEDLNIAEALYPKRPNRNGNQNMSEASFDDMWLYDMPRVTEMFSNIKVMGTIFAEAGYTYVLVYNKRLVEDKSEGAVSKEDFDKYVAALKEAGYTDNATESEFEYSCEKYGVKITVVLSKEYPFLDIFRQGKDLTFDYELLYVRATIIEADEFITLG